MNRRQRLMATMRGEPVDRPAVNFYEVGGFKVDPGDPDLIGQVELSYQRRAAAPGYYEEPAWNAVLEHYRDSLPDTAILFPISALRCIERLKALTEGRMMLLIGDMGQSREEDLIGRTEPDLNVHGSFSLMVNYDALGRAVRHMSCSSIRIPK